MYRIHLLVNVRTPGREDLTHVAEVASIFPPAGPPVPIPVPSGASLRCRWDVSVLWCDHGHIDHAQLRNIRGSILCPSITAPFQFQSRQARGTCWPLPGGGGRCLGASLPFPLRELQPSAKPWPSPLSDLRCCPLRASCFSAERDHSKWSSPDR